MADVATMRRTIQTALDGISGLRRYDKPVGNEGLPAAIVFALPGRTREHETDQSDGERWDFVVELHVGMAQGMDRAQTLLDGYISTSGSASINATIDAAFDDGDFSGVADVVKVHPFIQYGFSSLNEVATLRADVPLTLWS